MNIKKLIASIIIFILTYLAIGLGVNYFASNENEVMQFATSMIGLLSLPLIAYYLGIWTKNGYSIIIKRIFISVVIWLFANMVLLIPIIGAIIAFGSDALNNGIIKIVFYFCGISSLVCAFCLGLWTKE